AFHQDPRYTPALEQEELVAAGYLGRKSGRGWYDHGEEAARRAPATEPDRRPPAHVSVGATAGYLTPLIERLRGAGVDVRMPGPDDAIRLPDGGELRLTDGRTATAVAVEVGGPVVLLDLSLDPATATRFAVSASDGCPDPVLHAAVGLLQQTGAAVSVLDDVPGLVVARTVAMLVNEAADVVGTGVTTPQQVDLAMLHGVNYPMGPLEWGERWGARPVVQLLDHLADTYRDGHYRAAPSLRRRSLAHGEGS
ncbi:MAG: 3-hydroxyacyl-CoA dehydrogenase family protein, partial [Actinomycetes bacterium]